MSEPRPFLADAVVAPLLLHTIAAAESDRYHHKRRDWSCFELIDTYVDRALDYTAATDYDIGGHLGSVKRVGLRRTLGAAVWARRELYEQRDLCGPHQRSRLRLPHFGCPSTFHLAAIADAARQAARDLGVGLDEPFAVSTLFDRLPASAPEALLRAIAAAQGGSASTAEQLVVWGAQAVMSEERTHQVEDAKRAEKARAVVRKKAREAIASGGGPVSLRTSHLTASGNSQVQASVNAALALWRRAGDVDGRLETIEILRGLGLLTVEAGEGLCADFARDLKKRQLIRTRPSALAARTAITAIARTQVAAAC